jgi:phage baseplate assembly protein W
VIAFPYRVDRTGRTAAPSDAAAHARELIEQVLFTAPGERVMRPGFGTGVHQMVFAPAGDQAATAARHLVTAALEQWLSGWIEVHDVEVDGDPGGAGRLEVTVRYRLRATGEPDVTVLRLER